jgi:hypothetical protein
VSHSSTKSDDSRKIYEISEMNKIWLPTITKTKKHFLRERNQESEFSSEESPQYASDKLLEDRMRKKILPITPSPRGNAP